MTDIKRAVDSLTLNREKYKEAQSYYEGTETERFNAHRFKRIFGGGRSDYTLNYCKTVVDTVLDRLEIQSVIGTDDTQDVIGKIWENNQLELDAQEIHRKALMYGDCFAIAWPDQEGNAQIDYNSPLTTSIVYDEENPRLKSFGVKMWESTNSFNQKITKLNLYYTNETIKYSRIGELSTMETAGDEQKWVEIDRVENPFNKIPVFHFRTHRPHGTPEHSEAIGPQDAINKLVINHMNTVDYHGAPQRYALSSGGNSSEFEDFDDNDTARENIGALQNGPGELWYLQGVTQVGQFNPADHKTFTEPLMVYVKSMASLTQTPLHYFQNNGQFASGEGLRTAEAPLMKKIRDRQIAFGSTWRELFIFALEIMDVTTDVQIKWAPIESLDTTDAWATATIKYNLGYPMNRILEEMGYDYEVADEIAKEVEENLKKRAELNIGSANGTNGMNSHNVALQAQAEAQNG